MPKGVKRSAEEAALPKAGDAKRYSIVAAFAQSSSKAEVVAPPARAYSNEPINLVDDDDPVTPAPQIAPRDNLHEELRRHFGHNAFRPLQKVLHRFVMRSPSLFNVQDAIQALIGDRDVLYDMIVVICSSTEADLLVCFSPLVVANRYATSCRQ